VPLGRGGGGRHRRGGLVLAIHHARLRGELGQVDLGPTDVGRIPSHQGAGQRAEHPGQLGAALEPLVGLLFEALEHDRVEPCRHARRHRRRDRRRLLDQLQGDLVDGLAGERTLAHQELVQHHAE